MQPGRVIAGRFRVEGFVGAGGMGSVYRAIDRSSNEPIALKFLRHCDPETSERFADEARLLSELRHSAIVRYVDHGQTAEGDAYLAMEWLEGCDLSARLREGALAPRAALVAVRRAAEALSVAHARGVIHRDIKPSNLYLVEGDVGALKLLDFGIARRIAAQRITATGLMIGTPAYMAPEQARAARKLDARVDIFSLGCVLFECLVGKPAFWGDHVLALLAKIVLEDAPRVRSLAPEVPRALDDLVDRMLAKDPEARPRDAMRLLEELEMIDRTMQSGSATTGVPRKVGATTGSLTRRERALVSVVVAHAHRDGAPDDATEVGEDPVAQIAAIEARIGALDAALEVLADGSHVVVLKGRTNAKDLAVQAARAALALADELGAGSLALATGRGELRGGVPVGDAIDRAVAMLRAAPKIGPSDTRVLVDEVTRALLPPRFELENKPFGVVLTSEGGEDEAGRTLLGKPTPFVGREPEMIMLEALADQSAREPSARAAVVLGSAGVGKSRLREELVRALVVRSPSPAIWTAAGDTPGTTAPLALAIELVRRAFGLAHGDAPAVVRRVLARRLTRLLQPGDAARVLAVFSDLLDARDRDGAPEAMRGDARLGGDRIRRAFLDWLDAECSARPVVLLLEDVHAADAPTVQLVDAALRELKERPLYVVAFGRPSAAESFPNLFVSRGAARVDLRELGRAASIELLRSVAGPELSDADVESLVERAAGNAFYLEELLRRRAEGHAESVPETVLAMAEARISEIDEDGRRLLRAASVFGRVFWRGGVALLVGAERPEAIGPELDALCDREVLAQRRSPRFPGEIEYTFRHALLCEAAYAMLVDADRALGHQLAATFLEAAAARDPRALAMHYDKGGLPERAVPWHVAAAEEALAKNDLLGAIASANSGSKSGAFGPELGALRLAEAEALFWLGRFREAEEASKAALSELAPGSASWFAGVGVAVAAQVTLGQVDDARALVDAIVRVVPADDVAPAGAIAAARIASHLAMAGRHEQVDRLASWVSSIAPRIGDDPRVTGHLELARGMRAIAAGDLCVFRAAMIRASKAFDAAGDLRRASSAHANAAVASTELGRYDEAEAALRSALRASARAGLRNAESYAKHNLGAVLARKGHVEEARALELAAIDGAIEQGDKRLEAGARTCLAQVLLREGDAAAARGQAEAAAELAASSPPLRAAALGTLTGALLALGEIALARAAAFEARELLEAQGGIEEGESLVRLNHARALEAAGSPEARKAFLDARDRLMERSRALSDPELVPSFLRDVVENAAILARAAEIDRRG